MSTPPSNFVAESFSDVAAVGTGYCERDFACTHALQPQPNQRVVSQPNAFTAYYADTLGADGTAPLHSCGGGGASIGVVDNATVADLPARPDGGPRRAYQLGMRGVDGLVYVCVAPFRSDGIRRVGMRARAGVYLRQAGWHEEADELRAWAVIDGARAVSMLPTCAAVATRNNVDALGLRRAAAASIPHSVFTGEPGTAGDPALLDDDWDWKELAVDLGFVHNATACVGLQSGAGAEELFIDYIALEPSGADRPGCFPTALPDFSALPSCGGGGAAAALEAGAVAAIVLGWLLACAGAAYVGWSECVVKRRDGRARRPRALREVSLREVSLAPPAEEQHAPSPGGGAAASQAVV